MQRRTWLAIVAVLVSLSAAVGGWAQSSRVTDAELRMVVKQEQREREQLDREVRAASLTEAQRADLKRWEAATERVCNPTSISIEHQIEASRCKAQRYRIRRAHLLEASDN